MWDGSGKRHEIQEPEVWEVSFRPEATKRDEAANQLSAFKSMGKVAGAAMGQASSRSVQPFGYLAPSGT
jgi:hypothetical protein